MKRLAQELLGRGALRIPGLPPRPLLRGLGEVHVPVDLAADLEALARGGGGDVGAGGLDVFDRLAGPAPRERRPELSLGRKERLCS